MRHKRGKLLESKAASDVSTPVDATEGRGTERGGGKRIKKRAKLKPCTVEGCANVRTYLGGVCGKHRLNLCSRGGCTNKARGRGVCTRHGATRRIKTCSREGCTRFVQRQGVCWKHDGARCSHEGCTTRACSLSDRVRLCARHRKTSDVVVVPTGVIKPLPPRVGGHNETETWNLDSTVRGSDTLRTSDTVPNSYDDEEINAWIWKSSHMARLRRMGGTYGRGSS
jgi:hypothetical protein